MKAMILAAGQGRRLRPLTDTCPKPMIPLGGKPLLEHVITLLAKHGFDQLVVNLHHLPQLIRDYFGDGSTWKVRLTYSPEEELLGTAGAVRRMAAFFDQPLLVYYGDNLCNVDLTDFWTTHLRRGGLATMGLHREDDPCRSGIVRLDEASRIVQFIEKPKADQVFPGYLINAGIYALQPQIFDWIPSQGASDFSRDIFPRLLTAGAPIFGHLLRGQLLASDTPERYAEAQAQIASGRFTLP